MTSFIQRNLLQDVTYWAPTEADRYGQEGFSDPTVLKGRWEIHTEQVRKPSGVVVTATTRVFLSADVEEGGYLALGDFATAGPDYSETPTEDAVEIQGFQTTPDLRNLDSERVAFL